MNGTLKKLLIEAYTSEKYTEPAVKSFKAMINPNTYTLKFEIKFNDAQGAGSSASPQVFDKMKPREFNFEFILDGTGVTGEKRDVQQEVNNLIEVVYKLDGDIHRPRFLKLSWGSLISKCVLKTADVAYNLFNPDGTPLRAKITASFSENVEDTKRAREENKKSPDLTHYRNVMQGDTLPIQAYKQYGDHTYYFQIARENKFKNFRKLNVGSRIIFPPINSKKNE